jgi:hypothetical protein
MWSVRGTRYAYTLDEDISVGGLLAGGDGL